MVSPRTRSGLLGAAMGTLVLFLAACEKPHAQPAFPHVEHLKGHECGELGQPECLTCITCHTPRSGASRLDPPGAVRCNECHQNGAELLASSMPPPRPEAINFDHQQHLVHSGIRGQCVTCHPGVVVDGEPRLPPMSTCLECHEAEFQQARCTPCHVAEHLVQLRPESFMRHDSNWWRDHARSAERSPQICAECHGETWCSECHSQRRGLPIDQRLPEAIERRLPHPGDFIVRHAIEARARSASCLSCHTSQSCDACHLERGVSAAGLGSVSPHPPGWVSGGGSRAGHGRAARRDIVSCMGCHDHGPLTNCIECHRVGGLGGNPHPAGWDSARSPSAAMCRYCHAN